MGHVGPSVCPSPCPPPSWSSVLPFLFDGEIPLPGQVVSLVIVCEAGLDVVTAPSEHAFGGLLHGCQELILLSPGPIAPDHVVSLVNCGTGEAWLLGTQTPLNPQTLHSIGPPTYF